MAAGMAMRAWKDFMELRSQQRVALEAAFKCAAAADDQQILAVALQAWHTTTAAHAQVSCLSGCRVLHGSVLHLVSLVACTRTSRHYKRDTI